MLLLILLFIATPVFSFSQINRSATELARERVVEYITTKIFQGSNYEPVNKGKLIHVEDPSRKYEWSFSHMFNTIDKQYVSGRWTEIKKPHFFSFYLDKKMKVVGAASCEGEGTP